MSSALCRPTRPSRHIVPLVVLILISGVAGGFVSGAQAEATYAAVNIEAREDISEHLLFADYDQELDYSEIYFDVWVQLKIDGEPQQWTPLSLTQRYVYLNDKTEYQMGWSCTENYTRLYPPGSGNQLRFAVFAVENGEYNPVYGCNDEWYMDSTTLDATEQWTEWLEAGQSQTLTFHYDTTEGR